MKAFARVLAIALVVATLCLTLASCGGIKAGTYYNGDKTVTKTYSEYTFKGSKFALDVYVLGNKVGEESFEGTYKVKDGEITFTWENADGEEKTSSVTFAENEDGSIKLGVLTYKPVED